MAFTITLVDCNSTSTKLSSATLGNGQCYTDNGNGTYTFQNCDQLAACAGQSTVGVSVSPTTQIPASGGSRTFSVYYYGKSSSFTATKSGSWSGSQTCPASTCPNTVTMALTASANTSTSTKTYTVTAAGVSASVTQAGATPSGYSITFPDSILVQVNDGNKWEVYITMTVGGATNTYADGCLNMDGGFSIPGGGTSSGVGTKLQVDVQAGFCYSYEDECTRHPSSSAYYVVNVGGRNTTVYFTGGDQASTEITLIGNASVSLTFYPHA